MGTPMDTREEETEAEALARLLEEEAEELVRLFITDSGMHDVLKGGVAPTHDEQLQMARDVLKMLTEPPKVIPANPEAVTAIQQICEVLWEVGAVTVSLDCPGYPFCFATLNSLVLDSWLRNNKWVVYKAADLRLLSVKDLEPKERLRLGIRKQDGTLCVSVAISAFVALKIAEGLPGTEVSLMLDGTPAHTQTVDFGPGSHDIDTNCLFAVAYLEEALKTRRAALIQGKGNMQALTMLITKRKLHVVQLSGKALASIVAGYRHDLVEYYGMQQFNFAAAIRHPDNDNLLIVLTSMQLGSTLSNPSTVHRAANMALPFAEQWLRAFILLAGGSPAAMPLFVDYASSELGALLKKEGAKAFDQVLHAKELLPADEKYICSSERGGHAGGTILTTDH